MQREIPESDLSAEEIADRWRGCGSEGYCLATFSGYVCTRDDGHSGPHIAGGTVDKVCCAWVDEPDE